MSARDSSPRIQYGPSTGLSKASRGKNEIRYLEEPKPFLTERPRTLARPLDAKGRPVASGTAPETWNAFYAARAAGETARAARLRDQITRENIGLVKTVALKIARKVKEGYEDADDMIQAGCIGLMSAVDRFDLSKGFKFSTYAMCWIHKELYKLRESEEDIKRPFGNRMPVSVIGKIIAYKQAFGCEPAACELGDFRGAPITEEQLGRWREGARFDEIESLQETIEDGPAGGDRDYVARRQDYLVDTSTSPDMRIEEAESECEIREEIEDVCTPSERVVVFGVLFDDKSEKELQREIGISQQAVNARWQRGLKKLGESREQRKAVKP